MHRRQRFSQRDELRRRRSGEARGESVDGRARDRPVTRDGNADQGDPRPRQERHEVIDVGREPAEVDRAIGAELPLEDVLVLERGQRAGPVGRRGASVVEDEPSGIAWVAGELQVPAFPRQARARDTVLPSEAVEHGIEPAARLRLSLVDPAWHQDGRAAARDARLDVILHPPERVRDAAIEEPDPVRGRPEAPPRRRLVGGGLVGEVEQDGDVERSRDPLQDLSHDHDRLAAVARTRGEVGEGVRVEEDSGERVVVGRRPEAWPRGPVEDVTRAPRLAPHELRTERERLPLEEHPQLGLGARARHSQRPRLGGVRPPRRRGHGVEGDLRGGGAGRRDRDESRGGGAKEAGRRASGSRHVFHSPSGQGGVIARSSASSCRLDSVFPRISWNAASVRAASSGRPVSRYARASWKCRLPSSSDGSAATR